MRRGSIWRALIIKRPRVSSRFDTRRTDLGELPTHIWAFTLTAYDRQIFAGFRLALMLWSYRGRGHTQGIKRPLKGSCIEPRKRQPVSYLFTMRRNFSRRVFALQ